MKAFILYSLLMTSPDGNAWEMDSHLTQDDCRAVASVESWSGYYDGANVLPLPDGAAIILRAHGRKRLTTEFTIRLP